MGFHQRVVALYIWRLFDKCTFLLFFFSIAFPKFAPEIQRTVRFSIGVDFPSSPVYGSYSYFVNSVFKLVGKILHQHNQLSAFIWKG